jgi:hypothetical protein
MKTTLRKIELPELVKELQKQNLMKKDFVVPSKCLSMKNGKLVIENIDRSSNLKEILSDINIGISDEFCKTVFEPIGVFHNQLAEKLNIPKKYYDKLNTDEHISLLDENVNYWFKNVKSNYLIRTFIDKNEEQGVVRSILSDRFRIIDNYDILIAVLEAIRQSDINIRIDENGCDISDKRMYIRFICPEIEMKAPELLKNYIKPDGSGNKNDSIISGFVITNSEVGLGSLTISPRAKVLACSNGLILTKEKFSQVHLGGRLDEYSEIKWSESTKQINFELIISQVKDYINRFASKEYLGNSISKLIENNKQLENPIDSVSNVCSYFNISEEKQKDILTYFMRGCDNTSFGLSSALTYYAHSKADADEQYELEMAALEICENPTIFDKPFKKK